LQDVSASHLSASGVAPPGVARGSILSGGELLATDWGTVLGYLFSLGLGGFEAISDAATKHDTASEDGADATLVEILRHILLVVVDEHMRSWTRLTRNESGGILVEGINRCRNPFGGSQEVER